MTAITIEGLSKRFGPVHAVRDLTFTARPGRVTGFLGANGAGKTTTLRTLLGLAHPTSGSATFDGVLYSELPHPARTVGAVLEATGFHPGRCARDHLRILAAAARIPDARVDDVLGAAGLDSAGTRRVGGFSLGMRQRLGLAAALLGDPEILVLDEPANGLDPDGIHWLRRMLRHLAADGRTVLVSSHVLAEVAQTVDEVVMIRRGKLVAHAPLDELLRAGEGSEIQVRTSQVKALRSALGEAGVSSSLDASGRLIVRRATAEQVGQIAARAGAVLLELHSVESSLEDVFLQLTKTEGNVQ